MCKRVGLGFLFVAVVGAHASAQNLVVNGGFETGDFTGWTQGGDDGAEVVTSPVHSGDYSCKLTPGDNDNIVYQTIDTTVGETYDFSVWLTNTERASDDSDFDKLYWNGTVISGSPSFVPGDSTWYNYSFQVQATGSTSQIGIEAYNPTGNYFLDDVSVTPAPEPTTMALLALGAGALVRRRGSRSRGAR